MGSGMGSLAGNVAMAARAPVGTTHPGRSAHAVVHLGTGDRSSQRVRLVDATLRCIARQGLTRTTVDDVAREAGVSRATVYRTLGGGKDALAAAVVETEAARFCSALAVAMGSAEDVEEVLVVGITGAARLLSRHEALQTLLAEEPEIVTRHLAFARLDRVLLAAAAFASPFFARWLEPDQASRAAEWAARLLLSYLAAPAPRLDLTREADVRRLVETYVLPGIQALRAVGTTEPEAAGAMAAVGAMGPSPGRVRTSKKRSVETMKEAADHD